MVFANLIDLVLLRQLFQVSLKVASPSLEGQLSDLKSVWKLYRVGSRELVGVCILLERNRTIVASIPRRHPLKWPAVLESASQVTDQVNGGELRDLSRPAGSNSFRAVHEDHRDHRCVIEWLNGHAFFVLVLVHGPVLLGEYRACLLTHVGENVATASKIFASLPSRSKLTDWH